MLSKEVKAEIYGSLNEKSGVYSGYITSEACSGERVYILSRRPVGDYIYGVVTAVITQSDGSEKYVVTQKQDIMYEPEIRQRLSTVRFLNIEKLSCLYEKSCGAVILYKEKDDSEASILLVKNQKGRFWSFPKGHVELWENEKETAVREIKEETDLDVEILDNFREISDYCPFGKIRKRVVFFLAAAKSNKVKIQESEIESYTWVKLSDAKRVCTYENDLRVIDKAREYYEDHLAKKANI
ncbi:MAG: NUDIX domain-containing protein [Clostridia bacterium]|nr:NUDIX domain-containing protein [Clostridia bacterium]